MIGNVIKDYHNISFFNENKILQIALLLTLFSSSKSPTRISSSSLPLLTGNSPLDSLSIPHLFTILYMVSWEPTTVLDFSPLHPPISSSTILLTQLTYWPSASIFCHCKAQVCNKASRLHLSSGFFWYTCSQFGFLIVFVRIIQFFPQFGLKYIFPPIFQNV